VVGDGEVSFDAASETVWFSNSSDGDHAIDQPDTSLSMVVAVQSGVATGDRCPDTGSTHGS